MAAYIAAIADAWQAFPAYVREQQAGDRAIATVVDRATRNALASSGDASAVAFAERALRRVLTERSQSERAVAESSPAEVTNAWIANRGTSPAALIAAFSGELVSQFARHAVARDVAGIVGVERFPRVDDMRRFAAAVGARLRAETETNVVAETSRDPSESWRRGIAKTFAVSRQRNA